MELNLQLLAESLAMKNAISALIVSHPDPQRVLRALDHGEQALLASLVPSTTTEEFLDAVRATTEGFRGTIPSPKTDA